MPKGKQRSRESVAVRKRAGTIVFELSNTYLGYLGSTIQYVRQGLCEFGDTGPEKLLAPEA